MDRGLEQRVGRHVRELREASQMGKAQFCLAAKISRPYLNRIETGKANLTLKTVGQLAAVFGIEPMLLLYPGPLIRREQTGQYVFVFDDGWVIDAEVESARHYLPEQSEGLSGQSEQDG